MRFYKTAVLINDLQVAQKKLTLSSFLTRFTKLDVLILDELGFIAVDKAAGQLLFQLVSDLYEQVSLIITSNLRFGDWNSIFADPTLTTAFLDRLTHKGRIVEFVGNRIVIVIDYSKKGHECILAQYPEGRIFAAFRRLSENSKTGSKRDSVSQPVHLGLARQRTESH